MLEYPKIKTIFKRDMNTEHKNIIINSYSIPEFEYLKYNKWIFTEKIDGTNIRINYKHGIFTVKGRTDNVELHPTLLYNITELLNSRLQLFQEAFYDKEVNLYGEGYGAKIQSGGKYRKDPSFILFDVMIENLWLNRENLENISIKLNLNIVPIVGSGSLYKMIELVEGGMISKFGNFIAEGIVAKPEIELQTKRSQRIITKLKYKDFQHN